MIEVHELRKTFGDVTAVDGVSFSCAPGSLFGLLGPNGAGKSTTIACLSGLLPPGSGRITVGGRDIVTGGREARRILGVVPQELALYNDLTAADNLSYWGAAYGLRGQALKARVDPVLERTGRHDRAKEPVRTVSGGMQRRLNFGCGIVHEPRVLLLDEPTVGVDPQSRVRLLELVRELVARGTCVLYTTHYMEEAQALCDRIGIIDRGKLLALGTLEELRDLIGGSDVLRLSGRFDPAAARAALATLEHCEIHQAEAGALLVGLRDATRRLPVIFATLAGAGAEIHETTLNQPTLESLFIKLTGRELRE